ncbi:MAG: DEAD/DEAH box helicase, partial [Roseibacillus sp. TMED18]
RSGLILHGGTKVTQRKKYVDTFQQETGPPFFVLSIKAGGTGLNLTQASHVIHFDRWWNPAVENQAIDRTHRIGQKNKVIAYRLLTKDSVEEKIRVLQHQKTALVTNVLGDEGFASNLALEDLQFILSHGGELDGEAEAGA